MWRALIVWAPRTAMALAATLALGCGDDSAGDGDGSGDPPTRVEQDAAMNSPGVTETPDAGAMSLREIEIGTFEGFTGRLRKVAIDSSAYCSLDTAGEIVCGGDNAHDPDDLPVGPFVTLDIGDRDEGCALDEQGLAHCWGRDVNNPPAGPFTALSLGDDNACGIRPSGFMQCWGGSFGFGGNSEPPTGTFVDLDISDDWGCAVRTDGGIECWGGGITPLDGDFTLVSVNGSSVCTLDQEGLAECHGGPLQSRTPTGGPYLDISLGNDHVCALNEDGSVECLSQQSIGRLPPPIGPWEEIRSHNRAACARAADGRVECWGYGFGDGAADLLCETGRAVLTGTVDAVALDLDLDTSSLNGFDVLDAGYRFAYRIAGDDVRGPGLLMLDGATDFRDAAAVRALADLGAVTVDRAFVLPSSSMDDAGPIYCAGAGSGSTISQHIDEVAIELRNLHEQRCPGTPVSGELQICVYESCEGYLGGTDDYSGTIDGMVLAGNASQTYFGGPGYSVAFHGTAHEVVQFPVGEDGSIGWAIIATSPETEFGGAIYCADATSSYSTDADMRIMHTLRGLSRLDDCPTATTASALTGCVR